MPIRGDRLRWPPRPGKRSNAARAGSEGRDGETRGRTAGYGDARDTDDNARDGQPHERDRGNGDIGTRQTLSTDEQTPAPRQPNERDTSADSQASEPRDVIRRAHDDVTGGQMDTDCRNEAAEVVERNESKRRRTP